LNGGAANIEGGVVINLRKMNSVTVSEDRTSVTIGGGAIWGEVYEYLDALGIATFGGRVSTVGVGGLSTGGKI
jgi:FAD/FMN-containing dehydrogenase